MRKNSIVIIILILVLAVVWSISGASKTDKSAYSKTVHLGAIIGLTGSFAPYGEMVKDGAQLAIADLNTDAGYEKYVLELQDSQSSPDAAISAYRSISGSVPAFITGQSSVALALAPLANKDSVVELNVSALTPKLRNAGEYVFSIINDSTIEVGQMADRIQADGVHSAAVLYQNDDAGVAAKDVFVSEFQKKGGSVADVESFEPKSTDARTQLAKIKQSKAQVVYVPAYPENIATILKQASNIGLKVRWYSWNVEGPQLPAIAGKLADGLVYTSTSFDASSTDPITRKFSDAFVKKFGVIPNIYAATAYDGIDLLAQSMSSTADTGAMIKNNLLNTHSWNGVSGTTDFDADHMVKKEVIFKTIKDGQFVNL